MDRFRPLSVEEQNALLEVYRAGELTKQLVKSGERDPNDLTVRRTIRHGEDAATELTGSMMKLTMVIARENSEERYGRERASDLMPDLVGEAMLALTEALKGYDPARCPSFNIYAGRVIRDRVRMVLSKDSAIKLPPSWVRIKRIAAVRIPVLTTELGRAPTTREIQADLLAKCMEWATSKLSEEQLELSAEEQQEAKVAKLRKQGMIAAIEAIEDVLIATQSVASLDSPVGDEGGASLGDMLSNPTQDSMFDNVELNQLRDALRDALGSLSERERDIVLYRFGFADGECWTYQKISEQYGVTAERIRQIEKNVLAKLRNKDGHGGTVALGSFMYSHQDTPSAPEQSSSTRRSRR